MLLHDSRRDARFAGDELVLLAEQDRSLWDAGEIARRPRGARPRARAGGRGPYVLQAAIACCRPTTRSTGRRSRRSTASWPALTGSPVVELNRAVAVAEAGAPGGAGARRRASTLDDYRYLHSTRAELLRRLGRADEARRGLRARARPHHRAGAPLPRSAALNALPA